MRYRAIGAFTISQLEPPHQITLAFIIERAFTAMALSNSKNPRGLDGYLGDSATELTNAGVVSLQELDWALVVFDVANTANSLV